MKTNSKSARKISVVQGSNPAGSELALAPVTLFNEGVDAIIDAQKNTLDATARYGSHAVELWKKAFYFTFGTPSEEIQRRERARVLPFRTESPAHGGPKATGKRRRGRSKAA